MSLKRKSGLVITAAGRSSRMGSPKALLKTANGETLIEAHIQSFLRTGGNYVCVVESSEQRESKEYDFLRDKVGGIIFAVNADVDCTGMFESIQLGLKEILQRDVIDIFILPVDTLPFDSDVFNLLAEAVDSFTLAVISEFENRAGHPVLIQRNYADTLCNLPHGRLDLELRKLHPKQKKYAAVKSSGVLANLNSPAALMKIESLTDF